MLAICNRAQLVAYQKYWNDSVLNSKVCGALAWVLIFDTSEAIRQFTHKRVKKGWRLLLPFALCACACGNTWRTDRPDSAKSAQI
eukprot:4047068-Amphidinium_carterae.1